MEHIKDIKQIEWLMNYLSNELSSGVDSVEDYLMPLDELDHKEEMDRLDDLCSDFDKLSFEISKTLNKIKNLNTFYKLQNIDSRLKNE